MNNITSRNHSEKRFQFYGKVAVTLAISFLVILLYNIFSTGISAFQQTYVAVKLDIPASVDKKSINPRSYLNKIKVSLKCFLLRSNQEMKERQCYHF